MRPGTTQLQVTFSMMEIYNEKIRDLLNPDPKTNNDLKVRTTPKGTYVEGAKAKAVASFDAINREMENGTAAARWRRRDERDVVARHRDDDHGKQIIRRTAARRRSPPT